MVPCLCELLMESVSTESSEGFASTFHFSIWLWPATTECRPISRDAQVCVVQVVKWYLSFPKNHEKHVEMSACYFQNNPAKLRYRCPPFSKYLFLIGKFKIFNNKKRDPTNYMRLSELSTSTFPGNSKVT